MKEEDQILWRYIDGQSTISERKDIERKLASDPSFKLLHDNLSNVHHKLKFSDLDQPSNSFTSKLMDRIALVKEEYIMFSSKRFFFILFSCMIFVVVIGLFIPGKTAGIETSEYYNLNLDFNWMNSLTHYSNYAFGIFGLMILLWMDFFFGSKLKSKKLKS